MIRFTDATVLAYTKLQVHKMRTGITVGIAGVLFGLLLAAVMLMQGVFNSVEGFREVGLNSRYIVGVSQSGYDSAFDAWSLYEDEQFVREVEALHNELVSKKKQAAAKYRIEYDPAVEDPTPIVTDKKTGKKSISDMAMESQVVESAVEARRRNSQKIFSLEEYLSPYKSATIRGSFDALRPTSGSLDYMKDGKEQTGSEEANKEEMMNNSMSWFNNQPPTMQILDGSVAVPFISTTFDHTKGEIPVIIPYDQAEKQLGLTPLDAKALKEDRYQRLSDVNSRIGEVTAAFCYRNAASQQLLTMARTQQSEQKESIATTGKWTPPAVQYKMPELTECGPVEVVKDTRSLAEKQYTERRIQYEKEIGTYIGDPVQQKVIVRGVGVSSSYPSSESFSVEQMISGLLASPLGYGATWAIPSDLLEKVEGDSIIKSPIFTGNDGANQISPGFDYKMQLVEFSDKKEARALLEKTGAFSGMGDGSVYAMPFGSSSLIMDEVETTASKVIFWMLIGASGIAIIILAGTIGRTISDGRKESAVFRAIGARRGDIAKIYGVYTLLLSFRVILFAAVLGIFLAGIVEVLYAQDATLGARLAYAAALPENAPAFHFIGVNSWYIAAIVGTIIVAGLLASIFPILRNARRNPINDMRDE